MVGVREPHVREEAPVAALADVRLCLAVRHGRSRSDDIQPQLLGVPLQLCRGHGLIVP